MDYIKEFVNKYTGGNPDKSLKQLIDVQSESIREMALSLKAREIDEEMAEPILNDILDEYPGKQQNYLMIERAIEAVYGGEDEC